MMAIVFAVALLGQQVPQESGFNRPPPPPNMAPAEPRAMPEPEWPTPVGQPPMVVPVPLAGQPAPPAMPTGHQWLEIAFSIGVLAFGGGLVGGMLWSRHGNAMDSMTFRLLVITIVVTAGLFLITAGYSSTQVSPIIGILGSILGYIFGKGTEQ